VIPPGFESAKDPAKPSNQKQLDSIHLLAGPQRHTLLYGGGRSGKTYLFCYAIMTRALLAPGSRHAILRFRANAARASIWLDTLPKMARLCYPDATLVDKRSDGYVEIHPGLSQIWIGGLDEKERVEKILGQEFSTIYFNECSQIPYSSITVALTRLAETHPAVIQRAYYDLNPVGTRHWTHIRFVQGRDPITLQPTRDPDQYRCDYINPGDNAENLSAQMLTEYDALPERLRKRFYEGIYQTEVDGALWTFETIEHARCTPADVPATLKRVVVAVDPSGTRGDEDERSDNIGIVVVGLSMDDTAYVLADRTCNLPPEGWARVAVNAYHEYKADRIVAEQNYGGDMVRAVLHTVDRNVSVQVVTASRGKAVRAEPVSALYGFERDGIWQKDQVRHAGHFPILEDQMLNFSTAGYLGDRSPDNCDALIWALTDLLVEPMPNSGIFELYREQARKLAEANVRIAPTPSYAPGSVEYEQQQRDIERNPAL